ncbi:hypothetical protein IBT47_01535 [Erwinia sp. S43]|uniref:reverse transcriptase domain-containing protein n=1 Tax=Erwinia sp. S43 TaxID=2769339 RepID=UPI00190DF4DC|nr:reverse transcriptase domain-containing protein [Erwinia sp. S43]MBK0030953.1 hypothetical protein [Erwinia sp. S43]
MNKNIFNQEYITMSDLYLAYRKAKSEAFYETSHTNAIAFCYFESDIKGNLQRLHNQITKELRSLVRDLEFIGSYSYIPKSINNETWKNKKDVHYRSVDPIADWKQKFIENKRKKATAEYRLIICPTVEYQILSALWIIKIGHKFEEKLDKNLSYGNRLRRREKKQVPNEKIYSPLNNNASGLFSPYFPAYKKWRDDGLNSMRNLIEENKPVTAITMDLEKFYHQSSPNFLLRRSFHKRIGVELTDDEKKLTELFIESINFWYENTPDYDTSQNGALPVGLSASKVISNVLLYDLDIQISQGLKPNYYGRYVDDIFIVFETPDELINGNSIINYISKKVECVKINQNKGQQPDLRLKINYASDCELKFTARKQKIFSLSGAYGLDFIDQISNQIKEQSSEYRLLPELPTDSIEMANKTLLASSDASLIPDALRKADVVSIRRLGLSLLLKDIESYSNDLDSIKWVEKRKEFYGLVGRYLLTPQGIFEYYGYLHRVFRLMIINNDFGYTNTFIEKLNITLELIDETTLKLNKNKLISCKEYFYSRLFEVAIQASTDKNFRNWEKLRKTIINLSTLTCIEKKPLTKKTLIELKDKVLLADFGFRSYKDYWFYSQNEDINIAQAPRAMDVRRVLRITLIRRFRESAQLKQPHWLALAFPTRPLTIQEIAIICPEVLRNNKLFKDSILALRGAKTLFRSDVGYSSPTGESNLFNIPDKFRKKRLIALTNYFTSDKQFDLALTGHPDESLERYERINKLINSILKGGVKADYIVFPECALPLRWAFNIAQKLAKQKISLIAGIEYYRHKLNERLIRNDCLLSLTTNWPGYNSNLLILQPKTFPSHSEKKQLKEKKLGLFTYKNNVTPGLPIYKHGDFHFGSIICSDLTNPSIRVSFQGLVDCLFVLEWNPDVKTFSYLVEGTSHDTHSFVVQVNNRAYGDSRVRVPYRTEHKRDPVRVKGGISDTYVIAEIDYKPLRRFQKRGVMTDNSSDFKPVPVGFKMSKSRF